MIYRQQKGAGLRSSSSPQEHPLSMQSSDKRVPPEQIQPVTGASSLKQTGHTEHPQHTIFMGCCSEVTLKHADQMLMKILQLQATQRARQRAQGNKPKMVYCPQKRQVGKEKGNETASSSRSCFWCFNRWFINSSHSSGYKRGHHHHP